MSSDLHGRLRAKDSRNGVWFGVFGELDRCILNLYVGSVEVVKISTFRVTVTRILVRLFKALKGARKTICGTLLRCVAWSCGCSCRVW